MRDVIPIADMEEDIQILVVTAPSDMQNHLSLGPIFKSLRKLEEIHIKYSSVPNIGAHSFWGLKDLKVLNLTHNSLSTLMDTNFKGIAALKHLDLSYNLIESVPSAVFRYVKHLHSLNLDHNRISNLVTRIFFGLTRLEHLDLSYNPLGELKPELFSDVPVLKKLSCASCQLTAVSENVLNMITEVKDLDLRDNLLVHIPDGIPNLTSLMSLKLNGNQFSIIYENTFSESPVSHVHLAHNDITTIETNAFTNASISHLDLAYNRLSDLTSGGFPDVLGGLRELHLSGNPLQNEKLFSLLEDAEQLHHLGLGDIGLSEVPKTIGRGRTIHSLNFSANFISVLPYELFSSSPHLRTLDISHNRFQGITGEVLNAISEAKDLRILRLEGNPWQCDQCHVTPLLRWLQRSPDQESGCTEPKVWTCLLCVGPDEVIHQPLALLPPGDLPRCITPSTKASSLSLSEPSAKSIGETKDFGNAYLTDVISRPGHIKANSNGIDNNRHASSSGSKKDQDDMSREYIDVLDELKIAPPLSNQPHYSRKGIMDRDALAEDRDTKHQNNITNIFVGLLSFLLILICIILTGFIVYKKRSSFYYVCDGERKLKRFWKRRYSNSVPELKPSHSKVKELNNSLTSLNKTSNTEERIQQMTELKLDETVQEKRYTLSNVIRETELI